MTKKGVNANELPSFNSIEDEGLRSHNRGAILANIYEIYMKSYDQLLYSMEVYMDKIHKNEQDSAKSSMLRHLKDRGYSIVS